MTFAEAIHASHAAAVIDGMFFRVDAGGFAISGTQTATVTLFRVDNRF